MLHGLDALPGRRTGVVGVKHQIHNLNSCAKSRTCRVHAASRPQSTLKLLVVSKFGVQTPPFFQTLNVIAAIFLAKVRRAIVGLAIFCGLTRGSSFPEIRMPSTMQASAGNNHIWISCSNTSARETCFPSFFVRADGIITGRLRRNRSGVLSTAVDTNERLYDGTADWRNRAMRGVFHSGDIVRDRRSDDRTRL